VKRSNRLVILVGLLLAVVAFVITVVVLNQNQAATEQVGPPKTTVLVATEDIAIGDPVTEELVETRQVELDAVLGTPLRDESQVQGQPALFAIPAGSQVTQASLGLGLGAQNISGQLKAGERAIAIVVDRVQGVDFLIQAGDSIDVIASVNLIPDETQIVRSVKVMLQNKRVLYVSDSRLQPEAAATPAPEGGAPVVAPPIENIVIIIAGTDQDAEVLRFAQRTGAEIGDQVASALSVTLRAQGDDTVEETTGITLEQLLTDYGLQIPDMNDIVELRRALGEEGAPAEEPAPAP